MNPYHLIERMEYEAVINITPKMARALPEIEKMVFGVPVLTDIQKRFYRAVMEQRYEKVFQPTCRKIMGQQMAEERQPDDGQERRCR